MSSMRPMHPCSPHATSPTLRVFASHVQVVSSELAATSQQRDKYADELRRLGARSTNAEQLVRGWVGVKPIGQLASLVIVANSYMSPILVAWGGYQFPSALACPCALHLFMLSLI